MSEFFLELSLVMLLTLVISFISNKLKQPLLIGYMISGLLAGPLFFNILSSSEGYESFSHIGVALLLFIVGLHLNLKLIKEIGIVSLISGSLQILITALLGYSIAYLFGYTVFSSILIAFALSFSSTIIIVKLLSDKKEIEKVQGKLAMGILIVQDLVAVIVLMILSSLADTKNQNNILFEMLQTFTLGIIVIISVLLFSKYILEKILESIAKSQDLFFIFIISWCLSISALFKYMGFSVEVGALLAGVALASSPYQFEISSKVKPLRDFFIVMFFILLGSQMVPVDNSTNASGIDFLINNFANILLPAIIISLFVIIIKPLIIFLLLNLLGFHTRIGFFTAISLGQISEFSLIMIILAKKSNLISPEILSLITLIAVISISVSTYLIMHSQNLYHKISKFLHMIEIRNPKRDTEKNIEKKSEVLVFGYDRIGYSLLESIEKLGQTYMVIDYNPNMIRKLEENNTSCIYGDANDIEFINTFDFESVSLLISTIPNLETSMIILKEFKKRNKTATIILTSDDIDSSLELYKEGADYVILPHFLGGNYVSTLLEKHEGNYSNILKEKVKHIHELKTRKNFGHTYPKH